MLEFRRIIAFSSRVHTYLVMLFLFFALLFVSSLFFVTESMVITIVDYSLKVLSWVIILEGLWVILASIVQVFFTKVLMIKEIVLTILRLLLWFVLSFGIDALRSVIEKGLSL